jgi:hypothetical protein
MINVRLWPDGWYLAVIQPETRDILSKSGESRNLVIALELQRKLSINANGGEGEGEGELPKIDVVLNYRAKDFALPTRLSGDERKRLSSRGVVWGPSGSPEADMQRSWISLRSLAQVERAVGFKLGPHPEGLENKGLNITEAIGSTIVVRLGSRDFDRRFISELAPFSEAICHGLVERPRPTHDYTSPRLPKLLADAQAKYQELSLVLLDIQEVTGIPGLHTDLMSDDYTEGVLERLQALHDDGVEATVETFKEFDEN